MAISSSLMATLSIVVPSSSVLKLEGFSASSSENQTFSNG
jgi:hypothetical protein